MGRHFEYSSDAEIRPALKARLWRTHSKVVDTVMLDELGICRGTVRVDIALVNGLLHGFEIKSDRDSLRRLASQATYYTRVFDRITLVVANRHLNECLKIVPSWWGVIMVEPERNSLFKTLRKGRKNPNVDPRSLVELLWQEEALDLLASRGVARGVRGKARNLIWDRVCEHFTLVEIAAAVRSRLKARVMNADPASLS